MKRLSNDLRIRVINAYHEKKTCREIAKIYQIGRSTVSRWIRGYLSNNLYILKKRKTKNHQATTLILNYVKKYPLKNIKQIKSYLSRKGHKVSKSTVYRILKNNSISCKKVYHKIINHKNSASKKKKFKAKIKKLKDVYSLDETGIYLNNFPRKGWTEKGTRCIYATKKAVPLRCATMIMIISRKRIENFKILTHSLTKDKMLNYLDTLPNIKGHLLMDNLSVHHCKEIKEKLLIKELVPIYNLPYTPELNPIEEVFSTIKQHLRQTMITGLNKLEQIMTKIVKRLNKHLDFNKFYDHAFNY